MGMQQMRLEDRTCLLKGRASGSLVRALEDYLQMLETGIFTGPAGACAGDPSPTGRYDWCTAQA